MLLTITNYTLIQEENISILGFSEGNKYFQIQESQDYDEQDINLGLNTYHIEFNDQKNGRYGGIEKIKMN